MKCDFCKDYLYKEEIEDMKEIKLAERTFNICSECHDNFMKEQDDIIKGEIRKVSTIEKTHQKGLEILFKLKRISKDVYV
jgi:hypothetical protein